MLMDKKNDNLFKCTRCGTCCQWAGYVRLKDNEIVQIAEFLDMELRDFTNKYTILTDDRQNLSLIEKDDGSCIFLNQDPPECEINQVKPLQCRNFPLIWNFEGWEKLCQGKKTKL